MELGRGRHYQYYPFINLGHYYLAASNDKTLADKYKGFMRDGLEAIYQRAKNDPFLNGIPYIWCSNNLTSAAITQAKLYNSVTGDDSYVEMETSLRDWLFGCNPWGTSMIVGYPVGADYPSQPHSSYTVLTGDLTYGGLVDGPVYKTVFEERAGKSLTKRMSMLFLIMVLPFITMIWVTMPQMNLQWMERQGLRTTLLLWRIWEKSRERQMMLRL